MGLLESVRAWFRRERADVEEAWRETSAHAEAALERRERQLDETPEEGLTRVRDEIAEQEDAFADLRRRITGAGASTGTGDDAAASPVPDGTDAAHGPSEVRPEGAGTAPPDGTGADDDRPGGRRGGR